MCVQYIESRLELLVKYPGDREEILSVKKIWVTGVLVASAATAFLTLLTYLLNLRILTLYGLALVALYMICLAIFLKIKRHIRIFFYATQLGVILITFVSVLFLGGILHSGGIVFAALASVVFSLVYPRLHLAVTTFALYISTVVASAILQPYLALEPELSPSLNLLFTAINSLWIAAFILFVIFYVFAEKAKTEKAKNQRLLELDRLKTHLYNNISHEFRTPLTLIMGLSARLEKQQGSNCKEEAGVIYQNGQKLLLLVNQMLDLAQIEARMAQVNMTQSDIVKKLDFITQSFHSLAQFKGIRLHFLPGPSQWVMDYDEEKLEKIIGNLLSNAIKFTAPGGDVYISIDSDFSYKKLIILIKDNGPGINPEDLPHIFEQFYRAKPASHNDLQQGTGLGLALVKEFVELMGGSIEADSHPGQGAIFKVILPVTNNAPMATVQPVPFADECGQIHLKVPQNAESTPDLTPLVLLIEDNPDMAAFVTSMLQPQYRVSWHADGAAGVETAYASIPDIVISDVMMPGMDGYEVCQNLKSDYRSNHIPVILLTARADIESRLTGFEKGADAYITKPFSEKELLVRVKNLLDSRLQLHQHYNKTLALQREMLQESIRQVEDPFVVKIKEIIYKHLDDYNFGVEDLCREINMSHSQLHRKLVALTGIAAVKFIRHIRLMKALELLREPSWNITAIALETGFQDPSYFGRVFKQEFGLTPLEWREKQPIGYSS